MRYSRYLTSLVLVCFIETFLERLVETGKITESVGRCTKPNEIKGELDIAQSRGLLKLL